jgi:hypothetical protein
LFNNIYLNSFIQNDTTEIPTGLELIGKGVEQEVTGGTNVRMRKIVFSSLLRLVLGYLFLLSLFLVVIQESTVLGIFFDVLALEFVENIDDAIFVLSKRGELVRHVAHLPLIVPAQCLILAQRKLNRLHFSQDSLVKNSG